MDLALLSKTRKFFVEYDGQELSGRYNSRDVTPEWTARLDLDDGETLLKHVTMLSEVITEWDLVSPPIPYAEDFAFGKGDVISFKGQAYRVIDFDKEYETENGSAPSPADLPSEGEEGAYGPFTLRNLGSGSTSYPVETGYDQIKRLPQGLVNEIVGTIIETSRGDVDDAKKDA